MKDDYLITIEGSQERDGETDRLSLSTFGYFEHHCGKYYISYKEDEASGFGGDMTTVKIEDGNRVTMIRLGESNSRLVMEKGHRHLCHYSTGQGDLVVGIFAKEILNNLSESGGELQLSYSLDVNANSVSENKLNITVKENSQNA
ncbi:MAG: DUF1934 domain-containing protein [Oscillospiraceae bacterium]